MTTDEKRYRECMAALMAVAKRYDMAVAFTVVDKKRCMFKYHFPTWSVIKMEPMAIRFRSNREDFKTTEDQRIACELSAHIVMQMRDIAANTFAMMEHIGKQLEDKLGMEHTPGVDFDPELDH